MTIRRRATMSGPEVDQKGAPTIRVGQVWERRYGWGKGERVTVIDVGVGDNPRLLVRGTYLTRPRKSSLLSHYALVEG